MNKKHQYKKPLTIEKQVYELASSYIRQGGKAGRIKQVKRLISALLNVQQKYPVKSLHQIGRRHVHWWDEQLRIQNRSHKTRMAYWSGWNLLWVWLNRKGEPPRPKLAVSLDYGKQFSPKLR